MQFKRCLYTGEAKQVGKYRIRLEKYKIVCDVGVY